jgi:hypothetical protein
MTTLKTGDKIEIVKGSKAYAAGVWTVEPVTSKPRNIIYFATAEKLVASGKAVIVREEEVKAPNKAASLKKLQEMKAEVMKQWDRAVRKHDAAAQDELLVTLKALNISIEAL